MSQVLNRLCKKGLTVNRRKSSFFQEEIEYLGYLLTPKKTPTTTKKSGGDTASLIPKNRRQLRRFLGMVNYYRDMQKRCSHILAPFSKLAGSTTKWQWTAIEQKGI